MSRELLKSMVYKDGKVFTRQCSNNVTPKHFYSEENVGLTKLYNKLGETNFEKNLLKTGILAGTIEILSGCNKTLKRLDSLANLLWNDKHYTDLRNKVYETQDQYYKATTEKEKNEIQQKYNELDKEIFYYIDSFYDKNISKFKDHERSR